jgi:hypothetical protein
MAEKSDLWYVRFPDGRVIRAKSTKSLRYHIGSGRIPAAARVRRSPAEEWTALEWVAEFVDLIPKVPAAGSALPANSSFAPRTAGSSTHIQEIKVLGLRGLVEDLINALDSALHVIKLAPAAGLGLLLGLAAALQDGLIIHLEPPGGWIGASLLAICLLLCFCLATSLITQTTFIELSRLRPARTKEIRAGLGRHAAQLFFVYFLLAGFAILILLALQRLPAYLLSPGGLHWPEGLVAPVIVARLVWEVLCWPLFALLLLSGPITVIEERSFPLAIREWWGMARRHLGRLLLYETMAILLGLLVSAPLLVPVLLTTWGETGLLGIVSESTMAVLGGLALAPCLAYVLVANVFIYLDLRYELAHANH